MGAVVGDTEGVAVGDAEGAKVGETVGALRLGGLYLLLIKRLLAPTPANINLLEVDDPITVA